jgi:hypothetical protein
MEVPSARGAAPQPIQGQLAKPLIPTHDVHYTRSRRPNMAPPVPFTAAGTTRRDPKTLGPVSRAVGPFAPRSHRSQAWWVGPGTEGMPGRIASMADGSIGREMRNPWPRWHCSLRKRWS